MFSNLNVCFLSLQNDPPSTLRKLVYDELKKFNDKKNEFVGAQGWYFFVTV